MGPADAYVIVASAMLPSYCRGDIHFTHLPSFRNLPVHCQHDWDDAMQTWLEVFSSYCAVDVVEQQTRTYQLGCAIHPACSVIPSDQSPLMTAVASIRPAF